MTEDGLEQVAWEHADIAALLPWYVNGSIGQQERLRVDEHLQLCARCRDDLAVERRIHQGMNAGSGVEYMPVASLKRLQSRLDEMEAAPIPDGPATRTALRRAMPWPAVAAASAALVVGGLGLFAANRWLQDRDSAMQPKYYTVTTSSAQVPGEVIRAVFSPSITLVQLQTLLDEAKLRIVSGPTEAGVYSLASTSRRPVNSSLTLLRGHAEVRFAESTAAGDSPSP